MSDTKSSVLAPVFFLSHGGGPLPLLDDARHTEMVSMLKKVANKLPKPDAILIISAHWEATVATITSNAAPELIYDYYNFPPESYTIKYPAPGSPQLAEKIFSLLQKNNLPVKLDDKRGFDHGLFVPLKIMYPAADIPCLQLSLLNNLDAAQHIQIGQALAELRKNNVMIIGSGFSFHNMQAFFARATPETIAMNEAFEAWLNETCSSKTLSETERIQRLINWDSAPAARYCHPREEHLLPLHMCYGAAGTAAKEVFIFEALGKKASAYLW
jgi:4,5-DOPA dioxygenase extradiol